MGLYYFQGKIFFSIIYYQSLQYWNYQNMNMQKSKNEDTHYVGICNLIFGYWILNPENSGKNNNWLYNVYVWIIKSKYLW